VRGELPYKKGNRRVGKIDSLPHNTGNPKTMRLPVTKQSNKEYINEMRTQYRACDKNGQTRLLDQMIMVCKMNRKYLIRVLNKRPRKGHSGSHMDETRKAGRPKEYDSPEILVFLIRVWHASNQACSKRLKSVLHLWLPTYAEATGVVLSLADQVLILRMSHSTIDRLIAGERRKYRVGKGRTTTKPGTLLKKRIPVKTNQWDEDRPGFLEVDTVGHCGTSTAGSFAITLNTVDIASSWVEPRAVWGKGEIGVVAATEDIEEALPFPLRGFDVDNGSEVLNHHMEKYLTGRKQPPEYTRSREYKKNDNAHIEGRNWTHIRQYLGYERFDNPEVVPLMNDLYRNEYSLLVNYFLPSVKLQEKMRIGSKIMKRHDKPTTPCDRLLASPYISRDKKAWLKHVRSSLNPFKLQEAVHRKIKIILRQCSLRPQTPQIQSSDYPASNKQTKQRNAHRSPERLAQTHGQRLTLLGKNNRPKQRKNKSG
jgi:hypothetical protein